MKKLVLLFIAVVLVGTIAFARDPYPYEDPAMCSWRLGVLGLHDKVPPDCEKVLVFEGSLDKKCCWYNRLCENSSSLNPSKCEEHLANGTLVTYNGNNYTFTSCCWESRENAVNIINGKGKAKGDKKTSPKTHKNKTKQPVKAKSTKVQATTKKVTTEK